MPGGCGTRSPTRVRAFTPRGRYPLRADAIYSSYGRDNERSPVQRRRCRLDLMTLITANRVKLAIALLAFGTAGYVIAAVFMRPAYRAEALVMPRQSAPSGMLAGLVGQA